MKEFQLTRYLRHWWWIVALLSALGGIIFYSYAMSRQTSSRLVSLRISCRAPG